ncbi:MAG: hypothetical protein PHI34_14590 [Acidobacteriota bacterium]|nr:hypothetical protein [Acidobacteriota bacterium]
MSKVMRVVVLAVLCVGALLAAVPGQAWAAGPKFRIRLWGGGAYVSGGDINAGLKGLGDYWLARDEYIGWNDKGAYSPAHLGFEFGTDVTFQITPNLGVGIGAGYVQASKTSTISSSLGSYTEEYSMMPKLSAFVLRFLNVTYSLPLGRSLRFNIFAGGDYYFAKGSTNYRYDYPDGDWSLYDNTASGGGFGAHTGLGLDIALGKFFSLFFEVGGRYARFGGLEGTYLYTEESGYSNEEKGFMTFYEYKWQSVWYGRAFVMEDEAPTGSSYRNQREAKIDFSGVAAVFGVSINF